jgi:serine/threonine protein kinase
VAIKVISKEGKTAADLKAIINEIEILRVLDHPNICRYFETYETDKFMYLVMQYLPGGELFGSIEKFFESGEQYNEKIAADMMKKILEALIHCHANKIVHRDIKPGNMLLDADGNIVLVDFGLAKQFSSTMDEECGTPYFMPPEVIDGNY